MRTTLALTSTLLLAACDGATGPAGEQGPQGALGTKGDKGDPGERGPAGAGLVYVDALGTEAPDLVPMTVQQALYFDGAGNVWLVPSVAIGSLNPANGQGFRMTWESTDCTGTAYMDGTSGQEVSPRFVFRLLMDDTYRVRNDDSEFATISRCSADNGSGCQVTSPCPETVQALAESDTTIVAMPTFPYTPPLHPELRP